ncbi:MAG: bifunctional oligoribonuclease/PAP phosphatase NrnA [Oscillospiraceae bacterium]|nr:bifunctional oligoribonuclease/PAP phosphatase NrnA [Oscillospiraceae bacterium]
MYNDIIKKIKEYDNICLFVHNSMDGDTLGSAVAFAIALHKMGKTPVVITEENIPRNLDIMPGRQFVLDIRKLEQELKTEGKLAIAVDTADPKMFGKRESIFYSFEFTINIDHHVTNKRYGDINLIETGFGATAEVIYFIIKELNQDFDKDIAECLYTGICTDTGGFKFRNTNSQSHLIVSELLIFDLDVAKMHFRFFEANTISKIKISGYVSASMKFYYNGKVALAVIPVEVFEEFGGTDEDSDGLVNIGRSVLGVEISILVREIKKGFCKVSFRSTGEVDVSAIAEKFDGGGHRSASGCSINEDINDVEDLLLKSVDGVMRAAL